LGKSALSVKSVNDKYTEKIRKSIDLKNYQTEKI